VKAVTCPKCQVVSSVPDEAGAYRCSNCGSFIEGLDRGRPRVREGANNSPAVKALVLALGAAILIALLVGPCHVLA
jgi:ribosomal protein L34E